VQGATTELRGMLNRSIWVERLSLTNFRNYRSVTLDLGPEPVVLIGPNGAGKTNLLEAVSLLAPGQGLRRAPFPSLARNNGPGDWAVAAHVCTPRGSVDIGTGQMPEAVGSLPHARAGRLVRMNGLPQSGSGALADWVEVVWLTPAMDGIFTGPASERRAFLDRLTLCFDPSYRIRAAQFERAMRQRNRLLQDGVMDKAQFTGLERIMAETGVATAAARAEAAAALSAAILSRRDRDGGSPFPWSRLALDGWLEQQLAERPAIDVEDSYLEALDDTRERDRAAGRALIGPHRTDVLVEHGPKAMPAQLCSTGEQKALLVGLVLAHAEMLAVRRDGAAPILLLDEIAAHLDASRRAALFADLTRIGAQTWATGTDRPDFAALEGRARFLRVEDGRVEVAT
jgi:DNA replication and repair protein RecF